MSNQAKIIKKKLMPFAQKIDSSIPFEEGVYTSRNNPRFIHPHIKH